MTQKRRIWRWLTVFFAMTMLLATAVSVSAATASGRCGSKLYWSYDEATGTLAFTGTGAMFTYAEQDAPWLVYAQQIQKITFEKGITTIADRAFYGLGVLETVQLPNTVTSVGASAFEGCISLTSLPLGGGSCTVGENAFRGCTGLKSLVIPEGITSVGAGAFEQCEQAQSLSIPQSLTEIGNGAFRGCTQLQTIDVAAGNSAFRDSGNCLLSTDGILLKGSENGVIPTDGSIHTIGADAFRDCVGLKTVTIPNSVTAIEDYAFLGCTGLTQVNFGTGLEKVGLGAFQGCSSLVEAVLPDGLTEIGTCAFSGCTELQTVNFPQNLESLGSWSFAGTAIKEVNLSSSVDVVGINPFRGCRALTSISVNYRNRTYKAQGNCLISSSDKVLVSGCSASRIAETTATTIGRDAFRDLNIGSLTIPDSVQTIEQYAFADAVLAEIYFGAGVRNIQGNPLMGCSALISISVSEENTVYRASGNCLITGTTLISGCEDSQIPDGVTTIGPEAFRGTALTEIALPEGLTHIQKRAFFGCQRLYVAKLPNSIAYIGESAFELSALEYLSFGQLPQIDSYAFLGCYGLKNIYTPDMALLKPGTVDYGYIAYYVRHLSDAQMTPVLHYIGNTLKQVYMSLPEALEACSEGWLQLGDSVEVDVTLTRDLYIDLAGFDMSGTMDTAGFLVYGMDSTTADYTCADTGRFTCISPTGAAVVPQRHFHSDLVGQDVRYMAVEEDDGYSFHCFFVDMVYASINVDRIGVGYKAEFWGDEKVLAQLDPLEAFNYELCLEGYHPVIVSIPAAKLVSGEINRMLVYNYQVQEHGETPLSAWVSLKLADGTVIRSDDETITLRGLTEYINDNVQILTEHQLTGLLNMMETFPIMKTWNVEKILVSARRNWRYV